MTPRHILARHVAHIAFDFAEAHGISKAYGQAPNAQFLEARLGDLVIHASKIGSKVQVEIWTPQQKVMFVIIEPFHLGSFAKGPWIDPLLELYRAGQQRSSGSQAELARRLLMLDALEHVLKPSRPACRTTSHDLPPGW